MLYCKYFKMFYNLFISKLFKAKLKKKKEK